METEVRIMAKVHGLRNSIVNRKKKRKKGWGGNFRDRLDLPKGAATPILLCPGDYEDTDPEAIEENGGEPPHFHYDHRLFHNYKWNEGKKQRFMKDPCTATWQQYRDRQGHNSCIGCHLKKHGDKRVGNSEQYSLNVIHLSMYQKVPLTDREGKTRRFEHDGDHHKRGDPILGWKHITAARDLKEAKANLEDGLDDGTLAMWRKKYIQVGPSHRTQIELIADYAEQFCRCGGELTPSSFFCAGCGDELCDVEDSNMVPIYDFEFPDGSSLCEWDDDEDDVAFDDDDNFILREDVAKLVNNQFDFDKVHNPRDADLMARLLDVDNPFSGGGARSYAKSRNRFSDDDDGDDETDEKPRGRGRRGRGGRRGRTRA
jgi:hypothetical protein